MRNQIGILIIIKKNQIIIDYKIVKKDKTYFIIKVGFIFFKRNHSSFSKEFHP